MDAAGVARSVDSACSADRHIALGIQGVAFCCCRQGARSGDVELGALIGTVYNGNAVAFVIGNRIGALVAHVELTAGSDASAVITIECHVVGAVPGPRAAVASCGAGVIGGAVDLDPLGRKRNARHEQRAHRKCAGQAADDAAGHAAPAATGENGALAHGGLGVMKPCNTIGVARGGRKRGHGRSNLSRGLVRSPLSVWAIGQSC